MTLRPQVTLRTAGAGDLAALLPLYRQLYEEIDPGPAEEVEAAWLATLATPGRTVLVAELAGRAVGTVDLTVLADAARGGRPVLLVENVVVDRDHRRAGIGRALLAAAREHGAAAGCYKLELSADDPAAFAFYEAVGLRPLARAYKLYL